MEPLAGEKDVKKLTTSRTFSIRREQMKTVDSSFCSTLILHLGPPKTGTTHLQNIFSNPTTQHFLQDKIVFLGKVIKSDWGLNLNNTNLDIDAEAAENPTARNQYGHQYGYAFPYNLVENLTWNDALHPLFRN